MDRENLKAYPIQAINIAPRDLHIKTHVPPTVSAGFDEADFDLDVGHSDYYADEKLIQIATRIVVGDVEPKLGDDGILIGLPFYLNVELVGIFKVDDSHFPADRIYEWATTNAMFIMYPYLREHVFALTSRAGLKPMLLPLVEVPLLKIERVASPAPEQEPHVDPTPSETAPTT